MHLSSFVIQNASILTLLHTVYCLMMDRICLQLQLTKTKIPEDISPKKTEDEEHGLRITCGSSVLQIDQG